MVNQQKWLELLKKGYSLDLLYYLQLVEKEESIENTSKTEVFFNTLVKKGLLSDDGKLTLTGKELLDFVKNPSLSSFKKTKPKNEDFDKWWQTFPATDTFEVNGKKFKGTRALRVKKEDCKAKIEKILNEGEYTIDDLIGALKLEVEQKIENSYKTGQNKLQYMQNSSTYLHQKTYEAYIELYKSGHKSELKQEFDGINI